jgi:large subunit ribosomal protein L21
MSDKIAVIKTGGKQYKVREGQDLRIEKLESKEGEKIKFETLLVAATDGKDIEIGKPSLGDKVEGKIVSHGLDKKTLVVKYKNKTRYLRTKGHRQNHTMVQITKIA